jgi:hypothetical protein
MDARQFEGTFQRRVLSDLEVAVRKAISSARPVSHLGLGQAVVANVASNRRIFGADGKVRAVRYTACADPDLRAAPEGTIDPLVSLISFWNGDTPVAVLSYYATHPQSYYRTGIPNPDFPGIARFLRQLAVPSALHIHFNGAGGNIGAGKYNDGSPTNRWLLAERLADGMQRAWENTKREPLDARTVSWTIESVALPLSKHLSLERLETELKERDPKLVTQGDASRLAWLRRCQSGYKIDISCFRIGQARMLHMPANCSSNINWRPRRNGPISLSPWQPMEITRLGTSELPSLMKREDMKPNRGLPTWRPKSKACSWEPSEISFAIKFFTRVWTHAPI